MKYYLGIDGGGSNTDFLLTDEEGAVLSFYQTTTCYYGQVGLDGFAAALEDGIANVCADVEIPSKALTTCFIAAPGYGESPEAEQCMKQIARQLLGNIPWNIQNDVMAAWAGALGLQPGISILAGTGSMAYGRDDLGKAERCGGWGHLCGDEGSAYWLGRLALELFTKQADGRLERSLLYDLMRETLRLKTDFAIIDRTIKEWQAERSKIAGLAPLLHRAAAMGDEQAQRAFAGAAWELALLVETLVDKLNFHERIKVSYAGGVFQAGSYLLEPLKYELAQVDQRIVLQAPQVSPVKGAVLLAKQLDHSFDNPLFLERLQASQVRR